jgi:hypothetical protein
LEQFKGGLVLIGLGVDADLGQHPLNPQGYFMFHTADY